MKLLLLLLVFGVFLISSIVADEGEEYCYWKSDGSQICGEEGEIHDIWTKDMELEKDTNGRKLNGKTVGDEMLSFFKDNDVPMSKLELELLLIYLDNNEDGSVDLKDLKSIQELSPLNTVKRLIHSFNLLDLDDDGKLTKAELPVPSAKERETEESPQVTVLDFSKLISRLDPNIKEILTPFWNLDFLTPVEIKKVIIGSTTIFNDYDEDESEGLSMEEYLNSVNRPDNPRAQNIPDDQKESIFKMLDKNGDGEISYTEFQGVVPQKPKSQQESLEAVFKHADTDGDGFWSKDEFQQHLLNMIQKSKGSHIPSSEDIDEAYAKLDENGDGRVSQEEMQGISKEISKIQEAKAKQGFKEMDVDEDGVLSRSEMETMSQLMEERAGQKVDVDMLMKMLDKNDNGVIEPEEIQALVQRMTNL